MLKRQTLLVIIPVLWAVLILSFPVWGQQTTEKTSSTAPPSLIMVIVIDETMTMHDGRCAPDTGCSGGNSLDQLALRGLSGETIAGSDDSGQRHLAVRQLIDLLNSDRYANHQVAVVRMDYEATDSDWVTLGNANESLFVTLGQGSNDIEVQALKNAVASMSPETGGRGADSSGVMTLASNALDEYLGTDLQAQRKPVIVWITDDVPLVGGLMANIPYSGSANYTSISQWRAAIDNVLTPTFNTGALPPFNEVSHCRHNGGGLVTAVFSMGAGNWINAEGSQIMPTDLNTDGIFELDEIGNTYANYARSNGWLGLDGTPLVWAIDPLFQGVAALERDFDRAIAELVSELRCTRLDMPSTAARTQTDQKVFDIEVSSAYRQVRINIHSNSPATITNTTTRQQMKASKSIVDDGYAIHLFERNSDDADNWAGDWQVVIPSDTGTISVEFEFDLSELRWDSPDVGRTFPLNSNIDYRVEIYAQTGVTRFPITDAIPFTIQGKLNHPNGPTTLLDPPTIENGQFVLHIPDDILGQGTFSVSLAIAPKFRLGSNNPDQFISLPPERLNLQFQDEYGVQARILDGNFDCRNGTERIEAIVSMQRRGASLVDLENLYAYANVEIYLPPLAFADSTPTPSDSSVTPVPPTAFAKFGYEILPGTEQPPFIANIDCAFLPSLNGPQQLEVVAQVQDKRDAQILSFSYTASPVPTSLPRPTATQFILPTATPAPFSTDDSMHAAFNQPLFYLIMVGVLISGAGWGGIRIVRNYDELVLGLRGVQVRCDDEAFEFLLPKPLSWMPGQSAQLLAIPLPSDSNPIKLLEINAAEKRQALRIHNLDRNLTPFDVNGRRLQVDQAMNLRLEELTLHLFSTRETIPFPQYALELHSQLLGMRVRRVRLLVTTNSQPDPHVIVFYNPHASEG